MVLARAWRSLRRDGAPAWLTRLSRALVPARRRRPPSAYFVNRNLFQITTADLEESRRAQERPRPPAPTSATWFVPHIEHLRFGGIHTIFRFIDGFASRGLRSHVVIVDFRDIDTGRIAREIGDRFPALAGCLVTAFHPERSRLEDLPPTDVGVCTTWPSAYWLLRFNQVVRKFYFVQDYEPLFFPAGSTAALAQSTYRFGFRGIVNTPGLLAALERQHGMEGVSFVPAVDPDVYYPPPRPRPARPVRVFFYGRPNQPRNAFELGVAVLGHLHRRYGDRVELVAAGGDWRPSRYGLGGVVSNLGVLGTLDEVGALYRTCHVGFVYMLSRHPSYQPLEYMACGVATVANYNEDNLWLLRDGENCLLAEPGAAAMAEKIGLLVDDADLRERISQGGVESVGSDWEAELDKVWRYVAASP